MGGASSTPLIDGVPSANAVMMPGAMPSWRRAGAPVTLHIYDLGKTNETQALNRILRVFGSGAFHCGVEVYGKEWSYRGASRAGTGVFHCRPRSCDSHTYCESVPMGETFLSEGEVVRLLRLLEVEWLALAYSVLRHNCCHFSDLLCTHLGVGAIPPWVKSLAEAGAAVEDKVMGRQSPSRPTPQVAPPVAPPAAPGFAWPAPGGTTSPRPPPPGPPLGHSGGSWFWNPPAVQEPIGPRSISPPPGPRFSQAAHRVVPPREVRGGYSGYNFNPGLRTKVPPPGMGPEYDTHCWPVAQAFRDGMRL